MTTSSVSIPSVITANTYYWTPGSSASNRRRNEERNLSIVCEFFKQIGFDVEVVGSKVKATGFDLEVEFYYSESCHNVYKSFSVLKNGKKSNITAIKKLLA